MTIQSGVSNVTSNPIGAIVGAVAFYLGAKKVMKVENKWAVGGLTALGVIVGSMAQAKFASKAKLAKTVKP